jgi:hypothetical protein
MLSVGDGSITMAIPGESSSDRRNSISEEAVDFSAIARAFFSAGSVPATLSSVVQLAAATVEGCDYAGLFLIEGNVISTPAFTDPMVVEIDDLQLQTGQGPCLDAISHRLTFYSTDLARDLRWLHFAPRALGLGIHSILALPLDSSSQLGSLSLSARDPAAFDSGGPKPPSSPRWGVSLSRWPAPTGMSSSGLTVCAPPSSPAKPSAKPLGFSWNGTRSPPVGPSRFCGRPLSA